MDITVLASGSKGNCYKVYNADSALLLECGIPYKQLQAKLGYKTTNLTACLITHEHKDHSRAAVHLLKAGIDCYMTQGTADNLDTPKGYHVKIFKRMDKGYYSHKIGSFMVTPFKTRHDAAEPVGFVIRDTIACKTLIFITDTGYIYHILPQADYMILECNFVQAKLDSNVAAGLLHVSLRNRIVQNHMSLERALGVLRQQKHLQRVYLAHLSDANSDAQAMQRAAEELLGVEVIISTT